MILQYNKFEITTRINQQLSNTLFHNFLKKLIIRRKIILFNFSVSGEQLRELITTTQRRNIPHNQISAKTFVKKPKSSNKFEFVIQKTEIKLGFDENELGFIANSVNTDCRRLVFVSRHCTISHETQPLSLCVTYLNHPF